MKNIFEEYGDMILSVIASVVLMAVYGEMFLNPGSVFSKLIQMWGNGGC